ncbi:hypothetical protein TrVFT333_007424 [Trichoderma virens FT-333]|nr:hypothetical protein TrVFT333_007424 [Trichoderma virens FT-333]
MASNDAPSTPEFELLYQTEHGTWFATKKNDYGSPKYIAQPFGILDGSNLEDTHAAKTQETAAASAAFYDLMNNLNQGPTVTQIFNHENIISIAGHIKTHPILGIVSAAEDSQLSSSREYIVLDYCDAGNLSALFQNTPCTSPDFYLPESLCWHVLTSLLNAITYLHDGKRLFLDTMAPRGRERQWLSVDQDWNPILHRAIEPRNIFFQHPRGSETYGLCKLGNFEHAAVTNHVILPGDEADAVNGDAEISRAMAPHRGFESLDTTRHKLHKGAEANSTNNRPYTVADELFSVGAVIFTMMTGREFPFYCKPAMARYSRGLRQVVADLLALYPSNETKITKVLPLTKLVMEHYRDWKNGTDEGKWYKDIEDDMTGDLQW